MIRRIEHTTITVSDARRSIDFNVEKLGFALHHEMWIPESNLRIAFLRLGDTELEIFDVRDTSGAAMSDVNEVIGYKHICLLVDSVDEEYRRLSSAGVLFRIPPTTVQSVRIAFLKDPDGLDIELLEYLPGKTS
jgi:catechol 2,3-dioxygenase-like lactoylglutathione lyase family enzyme